MIVFSRYYNTRTHPRYNDTLQRKNEEEQQERSAEKGYILYPYCAWIGFFFFNNNDDGKTSDPVGDTCRSEIYIIICRIQRSFKNMLAKLRRRNQGMSPPWYEFIYEKWRILRRAIYFSRFVSAKNLRALCIKRERSNKILLHIIHSLFFFLSKFFFEWAKFNM